MRCRSRHCALPHRTRRPAPGSATAWYDPKCSGAASRRRSRWERPCDDAIAHQRRGGRDRCRDGRRAPDVARYRPGGEVSRRRRQRCDCAEGRMAERRIIARRRSGDCPAAAGRLRFGDRNMAMDDALIVAGTKLKSRLFVGTAGYPNQQLLLESLEASGAELVTVSIRRVSLEGYAESLVDLLGGRYRLLPNTSGCVTARDAILTAELAREALETDWARSEEHT